MDLVKVAIKCPRCGSKFNSVQVSAWIDTGIRNSELRQHFAGQAPQLEQYAVCTCPTCGKSDWTSQFPVINEETVLTQPSLPAHLQFRASALAAEQERRDYYNAGIFYLYAAWCADDNNAIPQAREYRYAAIQSFRQALNGSICPPGEKPTLEYLIGELLRRVGEFEAAQVHLSNLLHRLPGKLAYMARKVIKLAVSGNSQLSNFDPPG